jgi:hypothetical protein
VNVGVDKKLLNTGAVFDVIGNPTVPEIIADEGVITGVGGLPVQLLAARPPLDHFKTRTSLTCVGGFVL